MHFIKISGWALLAFLPVSTLSVSTQASELDFALSKETAALELYFDTGGEKSTDAAKISLGGLYNEDDDLLGFIGVVSGGTFSTSVQPYSLGVGVRLYYASIETPDVKVGALALGGNARIKFSAGIPLALVGEFHYAPKITTFEKGDSVLDTRIRLESEISESATAFIGYRTITLGLKSGIDYEVDDRVQLGVRIHF